MSDATQALEEAERIVRDGLSDFTPHHDCDCWGERARRLQRQRIFAALVARDAELARWRQRLCEAGDRIEAVESALALARLDAARLRETGKAVWELLDDGVLVRDTSHDHDVREYHKQAIDLTLKLKAFDSALATTPTGDVLAAVRGLEWHLTDLLRFAEVPAVSWRHEKIDKYRATLKAAGLLGGTP